MYHLLNLNLKIFFWLSLFLSRYSRYLIIEFSYLQEALYLVNNSVSYLQSCLIFWEQRGTTYSILLIFKGSMCFIFLNDNDEQSAHTQINAAPVSCRQSFCFPSWHWRWQPGPAPSKRFIQERQTSGVWYNPPPGDRNMQTLCIALRSNCWVNQTKQQSIVYKTAALWIGFGHG